MFMVKWRKLWRITYFCIVIMHSLLFRKVENSRLSPHIYLSNVCIKNSYFSWWWNFVKTFTDSVRQHNQSHCPSQPRLKPSLCLGWLQKKEKEKKNEWFWPFVSLVLDGRRWKARIYESFVARKPPLRWPSAPHPIKGGRDGGSYETHANSYLFTWWLELLPPHCNCSGTPRTSALQRSDIVCRGRGEWCIQGLHVLRKLWPSWSAVPMALTRDGNGC